jgi:hypothetical protein
MPDDLSKTGSADRIRINVHERWEVDYWCRKFDCTEHELIACVEKHGPMAEDVAKCIENEKADTQR